MSLSAFPAIVNADAYSGYGSGTSGSPYLIGTCSQLQSIANNLSADYELVRDINCDGSTIGPIGGTTDFSGVLNGNNHTITDFISSGSGIFYGLNTATVENLNLTDGTINGGGEQGSIAGTNSGGTSNIDNVHSSLSVDSSGAYTGGLVGAAFDILDIDQSSYTGSLTTSSTGYNGGLVGAWEGAGSTINDSFVAANLNLTSDLYSGGIVGGLFASASTINNTYSASTITLSGTGYNGGLVGGFFGSTITNSFAANTYSGSDSNAGAVVGTDSGTLSSDYYDSTLADSLNCSGGGSVSGCTAENVSNAAPNYFKSNSISNPFGNWSLVIPGRLIAATTRHLAANLPSLPCLRQIMAMPMATVLLTLMRPTFYLLKAGVDYGVR